MRACANPYFVDVVGRNGLWQDASIRWSAVMDTVKARARNNELTEMRKQLASATIHVTSCVAILRIVFNRFNVGHRGL